MPTASLEIPRNLPTDISEEMAKRACYCDPDITGCRFDASDGRLHLTLRNGDQTEAVLGKVARLVEQMQTERLSLTPSVLKERKSSRGEVDSEVAARLTRDGDLAGEGVGVVARSGKLLALLERLDRLFVTIAVEAFGAEVKEYNTLMPAEYLRRAGYFSAFAHSLTFAFHLQEDFNLLDGFAKRHREGADLQFEGLQEMATPEYCLSPAVCYHAYGALMNRRLDGDDNGLHVQTAGGRCFRYESNNITDLDRLWEFSMREIIFIGERDRVLGAREKAIGLVWRLTEQLDLSARLETATDPFFATDFRSLRYFQLANELKYELSLPIGNDKSVAVASFNYHESFFGRNFDIRTSDNQKVHTGCAAFGLERLALAILAQHGFETTFELLDKAEARLPDLWEGNTV